MEHEPIVARNGRARPQLKAAYITVFRRRKMTEGVCEFLPIATMFFELA
jgi:hypothetical protein